MFGEKVRRLGDEEENVTILEQDAQFEGKLTFEGKVHLNGRFVGEIFSTGVLVIGENAEVHAKIEIDTVIIHGKVTGDIQAKTRIEMHPPALVKGNIASPSLVISDGAIFEGSCSMGRPRSGQLYTLQNTSLELGSEAHGYEV